MFGAVAVVNTSEWNEHGKLKAQDDLGMMPSKYPFSWSHFFHLYLPLCFYCWGDMTWVSLSLGWHFFFTDIMNMVFHLMRVFELTCSWFVRFCCLVLYFWCKRGVVVQKKIQQKHKPESSVEIGTSPPLIRTIHTAAFGNEAEVGFHRE
jgi:hypothetical protein